MSASASSLSVAHRCPLDSSVSPEWLAPCRCSARKGRPPHSDCRTAVHRQHTQIISIPQHHGNVVSNLVEGGAGLSPHEKQNVVIHSLFVLLTGGRRLGYSPVTNGEG